jgi:hypothetical protein
MTVEDILLRKNKLDIDIFTSLILSQIESSVKAAFDSEDIYHGLPHAKLVVQAVEDTCSKHSEEVTPSEKFLLQVAAVLHDVGYAFRKHNWYKDSRNHIVASIRFAQRRLSDLPVFSSNEFAKTVVCYLIARHDDTNFSYPSRIFDGNAIPVDLEEFGQVFESFTDKLDARQLKRLDLLVNILREADASTATGLKGAERTFNYSIDRGIPIASKGVFVNSICWEESALTNVRIAAKRAVVDTITTVGRTEALDNYRRVEQYIKDICLKHGLSYSEEVFISLLSKSEFKENKDRHSNLEITRFLGWEYLEDMLRQIPLKGDPVLRPYADARIDVVRYPIAELRPTSHYVLKEQLKSHDSINSILLEKYAISIFDLTGILEYYIDNVSYRMSPPIVETYYEPSEQKIVTAIVDGIHRVWLARVLGLEELWVVEISNIPVHFPLVPLPANWTDIKEQNEVPETSKKRRYRFPRYEYFPDISDISDVSINRENFYTSFIATYLC